MTQSINYGVVGTGYFGADLARSIIKNKDAYLKAVYDPNNGQAIAEELDATNEPTFEALVQREDVDCIIVASPNYLHRDHVVLAAKHQKHIFCEKPIALSYEDCVEMVETCKEYNVLFMAGHIMNFFNGAEYAREAIEKGKIGQVLYCHTARNGWQEPGTGQGHSWKKQRELSGGHLFHHIHELDFVQWIMGGSPESVIMVGGNIAHHEENDPDEEDLLIATLKYPNNTFALLEWGSACHWGEHYALIQGTKGAIKLDLQNVEGTLKTNDEEIKFLIHETKKEDEDRRNIYQQRIDDGAVQYGKPGQYTPLWLATLIDKEMTYLHNLLLGRPVEEGFEKLVDGTAALEAIATAQALVDSLQKSRPVYLNEIYQKKEEL